MLLNTRLLTRTAGALLSAILVLAVTACGTPGGGAGRFAVEQVYGEGTAVQFTVRVSRTEITTAEDLVLELETRAGEQWRVSFPEIAEELGGFAVADREPEERDLRPDGTLISTRSYRLEPFLAGEYTIPSLELGFGEPGTEFSFMLVSDEIDVEVASELPPTVGEQDIEGIEGPEELEENTWRWVAGGAGGVAVLAVAAVLLFLRVRRGGTTARTAPERPPWQEAQEALDALLADEQRHEVDTLYTELTRILRHYIERRFDIRAPERTTEEFIEEARHSQQLAPFREQLEEFLTHADLVKFAGYAPSENEVGTSVESCRGFIEATTPEGAA
jgi:hypothetical protein